MGSSVRSKSLSGVVGAFRDLIDLSTPLRWHGLRFCLYRSCGCEPASERRLFEWCCWRLCCRVFGRTQKYAYYLLGAPAKSDSREIDRSLPGALASCAIIGTAVGVFDYGGRKIAGTAGQETQEERRRKFFKQPPPSLYSSSEPTDSE